MKYLAGLVLVVLAACASTPTAMSSIATAVQINTAAVTAAVSLANSGAISSGELSNILNITNTVEAALVTAEAAVNAGNSASAQATLTAVTTTLSSLTACLANKTTSTIAACIAGVPAP